LGWMCGAFKRGRLTRGTDAKVVWDGGRKRRAGRL
jgi:hypothetical protein